MLHVVQFSSCQNLGSCSDFGSVRFTSVVVYCKSFLSESKTKLFYLIEFSVICCLKVLLKSSIWWNRYIYFYYRTLQERRPQSSCVLSVLKVHLFSLLQFLLIFLCVISSLVQFCHNMDSIAFGSFPSLVPVTVHCHIALSFTWVSFYTVLMLSDVPASDVKVCQPSLRCTGCCRKKRTKFYSW